MTFDIGAAATRKIGPFPVVVWGVGVGGALLAWQYLRGDSSNGPTADPGTATGDQALVDIPNDASGNGSGTAYGSDGAQGETGPAGPTGPKGDPGAKGSAGRPGCAIGYKPVQKAGKWVCEYVPKPKKPCKKGYALHFNVNTFAWECRKKSNSFTLDSPHIGVDNVPGNPGIPVITYQDVPAIGIAPPSLRVTGLHRVRPYNAPGSFEIPLATRTPPAPGYRVPIGRPFHGD